MNLLTHNQKLVSAIGALYIIFGLLLAGFALLGGGTTALLLVVRFAALLLGGATLVSGLMLWRGNPDGGVVAAFVTALQVPMFATPSLVYFFVAGPYLNLLVGSGGAETQFGATAVLRLGRADSGVYSFGINVVALAMLIWFIAYIRAQSTEEVSATSAA